MSRREGGGRRKVLQFVQCQIYTKTKGYIKFFGTAYESKQPVSGMYYVPKYCRCHRSAYDAGYWWAGLAHCVCRVDKRLINKQRRKVIHESRHL